MPATTDARTVTERVGVIYFLAVVASIGEFIRSFDINIMSGAILYLRSEFSLAPYEEGFAMSSAIIGCVIGAIFAGIACDRLGRKRTLMATAILYGISALGTTFPKTITEFNLYRIIGGIGVGFASVACPLYIAEIAPARIRGRLVMLVQFAMVFGLTCATITTYTMSLYGLSWRWMMASEGVPCVLFLVGLLFVPESPTWFWSNGRRDEAKRALANLIGQESADKQLQEVDDALARESGSYRELFQPGIRKALIIGVVLAIGSQTVGMTTLMYYAPTLFKKTGLDNSSAILRLVILNAWNIVCTFGAYNLVDSLGRRPLLLGGLTGLIGGLVFLGVVFLNKMSGIFVLLAFFVCIGAYILSIAPLTWVIISEIFPSRIRGRAISIATLGLWLTVYCTTQFFPPMVAHFEKTYGTPAGIFFSFAGAALCVLLFCWRWIPETKGRTLEEIGQSWKVQLTERQGERSRASAAANLPSANDRRLE
jgi:MFS transporter, SP family, arabinose:H+ symporter